MARGAPLLFLAGALTLISGELEVPLVQGAPRLDGKPQPPQLVPEMIAWYCSNKERREAGHRLRADELFTHMCDGTEQPGMHPSVLFEEEKMPQGSGAQVHSAHGGKQDLSRFNLPELIHGWCIESVPALQKYPVQCEQAKVAQRHQEERDTLQKILGEQNAVMVKWWCDQHGEHDADLPCIKLRKQRATDQAERKSLQFEFMKARKDHLDTKHPAASQKYWFHTIAHEWCQGTAEFESAHGHSELCQKFANDVQNKRGKTAAAVVTKAELRMA